MKTSTFPKKKTVRTPLSPFSSIVGKWFVRHEDLLVGQITEEVMPGVFRCILLNFAGESTGDEMFINEIIGYSFYSDRIVWLASLPDEDDEECDCSACMAEAEHIVKREEEGVSEILNRIAADTKKDEAKRREGTQC